MKYNLGMVTYVIPMFRYDRMDACEEIVDCMIERWNDHDLELKISKSEFEQIQGGFKSRLCYITTAVCASLGKPDDCYELNLMRRYRDEYLVNQKGGEEIVAEYYDIAPTIVNRINRMKNSEDVYADIWCRYLHPCVSMIESDNLEACRKIYTDMVACAGNIYFHNV